MLNRAAGNSPNNVPRGFTVLDEDKSSAVLEAIPELTTQELTTGEEEPSVDDPVRAAFQLFRQDRLESLIVRLRRHRASEIRDLLRSGSVEPGVFDREVWRSESATYAGDEEITGTFTSSEGCPALDLLERVEKALGEGALAIHGNFHWGTATNAYGVQLDESGRRDGLREALGLLNRENLTPVTKAKALAKVPGFGQSTATGLVMLLHPDEFAVCNKKSRVALDKLGRSIETLDDFQQEVSKLRDETGAEDFVELDRFLYLVAQDWIFVGDQEADWPRVWWVNQGASYDQESAGGYVWAPTETKGGTRLTHHENVADLHLGDRILHFAKGALRAVGTVVGSPLRRDRPEELPEDAWQRDGYYAEVDYDPLDSPIELGEIPEEWRLEESGGPFTRNGAVQQGYLFSLSEDLSTKLVARFDSLRRRFPVEPPGGPSPPLPEARKHLDAIVDDFAAALRDAHLRFGQHHDRVVRDFVVSLATKQLVILTGLSGSGKTQIALQFGRWLGENQYRIVPVRPDWTGPEALFGYPDALREPSEDDRPAWHVPDPLEFMLKAARDPENPYLLVLDEMNLAHVERYFADVISGMESGEGCLPNLQKEDGTWRPVPGEDADEKLRFPKNLFIAGTVNVDETTYMFSPKVLDRANTMEFRVETRDLRADIRKPGKCQPGERSLVRGFLEIARDDGWHPEQSSDEREAFVDHLRGLHGALDGSFSFGHRVLYEAVRFASLYEASGVDSVEEALDVQVLQKVLPRIHGSRRRVEPVLRTVGKFCWDLEPADVGAAGGVTGDGFDPVDPPDGEDGPALPRSFDKVKRMTKRLRTDQFVSFTE